MKEITMDNSGDNSGRGAGVLCHISSLPGKYGIGSLGKEAYAFADFLKNSGIKYWQILPLVQTGYKDSPYQSVCCKSGNPYFIDLETLAAEGLLTQKELKSAKMPSGSVDYGSLYKNRYKTLRAAFSRFDTSDARFMDFVNGGEFEDYALFMSLKSEYGVSFDEFPERFRKRDKEALAEFKKSVYDTEYLFWLFLQFIFRKQWSALKKYVNSLGIKIIGDIPLYVAYDSSDVWGRPELFMLDEDLKPLKVAGVPPDYFSKDGQLWGNPLYDWEKMKTDGYDWWVRRIADAAELYDIVRIDHFRGLDRYYAIPADAETARVGAWEQGPGYDLFEAVKTKAGEIRMIAEDLGVLDDGVVRLREKTGFPGMKIALFAFDGKEDNPYLPHNTEENSVSYTGTHDNATCLGFLNEMSEACFEKFCKLLKKEAAAVKASGSVATRLSAARLLCACTLASGSNIAVLPVQDILGLDDGARMNVPSTSEGNWTFRLKRLPSGACAKKLFEKVKKYKR